MNKNIEKQLVLTQRVNDENWKARVITIEKIRDKTTGKMWKEALFQDDPDYEFFVNSTDTPNDYPVMFVPANNARKVKCKYRNLHQTIAKNSGQMEYYEANKRKGFRKLDQLNNNYDVFLSDRSLDDYKMAEWNRLNSDTLSILPVTKSYFDIEVDTVDHEGFPNEEIAPCEINFISYVNPDTSIVKAFILYNGENKSMREFLKRNGMNLKDQRMFNTHNNEWCRINHKEGFSNEKLTALDTLELEWFANESDLIISFLDKYKEDKPDFICGWNTYFDIRTIEQRLIQLGEDPVACFCPDEFPFASVNIKKDNYSTDTSDKAHTFDVSGYGHWVDLQYYYACIRKSSGKKESYSLENILLEEIGEGKYEYEGTISTAVYENFEAFLLYSLYDSYRLFQLETKNNDVGMMYELSLLTETVIYKAMKKTRCLRNYAIKILEEHGYIMANNYNRFIEHEKKKFRGALTLN